MTESCAGRRRQEGVMFGPFPTRTAAERFASDEQMVALDQFTVAHLGVRYRLVGRTADRFEWVTHEEDR